MLLFLALHSAGRPKIMEPINNEIEESFESTVELSCNVRGFPTPSVIWTTSDGKVQQREASHVLLATVAVDMHLFPKCVDLSLYNPKYLQLSGQS